MDKDVYLTIPRGRMKDLKASYVLNNTELHAPLQKTGLSAPLTSSWMVKPSTSVRWWSCRKFRKVISSAKLLITLN
nr:D-alanyl-D-alanine carboxypeptidase dacA precursor [Klebsiella pneumoniae]